MLLTFTINNTSLSISFKHPTPQLFLTKIVSAGGWLLIRLLSNFKSVPQKDRLDYTTPVPLQSFVFVTECVSIENCIETFGRTFDHFWEQPTPENIYLL